MGLSRRAYARHRGVSETAVRKAIAAGRIGIEPDGSIDPVKADAAWAGATDPSQQRQRPASPREVPPSSPVVETRPDHPDRTARPVPTAAVEAVRETLKEI